MNETILIVDDIPANLKLARIVLERAGYRVSCAASGEDALASVAGAQPDMVLMDLRLPGGMTGHETTAALRARPDGHRMLIIAVTASTNRMDDELHAAGFDGLLLKPLDVGELAQQVARFLAGRAGRAG